MKAILRAGVVFTATALAVPTAALAQTVPTPQTAPTLTPAPATNSTAPVTVGPSELQNFKLNGTVTRPADQVPVPTPARPQTKPVRQPALTSSSPRPTERSAQQPAPRTAPAAAAPQPATTNTIAPPPAAAPQQVETQPAPVVSTPVATAPAPEPASALSNPLPLWPWIAAALALAGGIGFLLWRRSRREQLAAGPQFDLLVGGVPEPEPAPVPRAPEPVLPRPVAPAPPPRRAGPSGIVASGLRPTLELGFHPLHCHVDDDQVAIEFELELFNAGAAPARAVFAEASLLNAGATQDQQLATFFANAHGRGEALDVIPPMKRISFRSQVAVPRGAVQEYELAGRKAFVPVIAFNALYEWSGGKGQSSAAYLVGRDTQQDKLGPLRLDQGAREFSGLGARPLPSGVRT